MRILIVDDNSINLKLLRAGLESEGCTVTEASDGTEALKVLDKEKVDAVIADILMPRMDGYHLCYEVRRNPKHRLVPFIIYSSTYLSEGDEKLAIRCGADRFIRKPARPEEILRTIEELAASEESRRIREFQTPDETKIMVEYNEALIHKLEERNVELREKNSELANAQNRLVQSQKMESIGRLAGGIAHDFNNLLAIITGYSELLLKSASPSDPAFESLTEINEAGDRAVTLVRQLLAFSRRQILEPRVLNLNQVVEGMGKMLTRLIGEDIVLKMALDPSLGAVRVDPGQMEQVIMNLAVNSRDAMPKGGMMTLETQNAELGESYCRDHAEVAPGRYVMLAVTDTGSGMDKPTSEKIFEPFFTTKGEGKGTGLGLATVYGIVKQSGGSIFVYSELGRGTSFKIYLPRIIDEAPERVAPAKKEAAPSPQRGTILLIEDEEKLGRVIRRILEGQGYTVLVAVNGGEANRLARDYEGKIDLLVADLVLPEESGADLARKLAARDPALRILYISGYTDGTVVRHGLLADKAAFLQKPFSPEALTRKVLEVLETR